ncbi:MBL fold metallo-hydrolase [Heyndrickxia acidicola]|uniref:MBL fold metallo-hydrolase n=1 Tax=Heyndrickxia acidicola TaxID=209389 RepID=A0ABU6MIC5_9BACI|nr:MBL fold metallo-hydrolase [Heyndrickxia acidicola]MED1204432.1 MBL fold metallo-hydrolase [Heyndrickxia acidicola]
MNIRLIRNATLVLDYADKRFLIDPFLAEKGSMPPFSNTPNQEKANPLVPLPLPIDEIIQADAVLVTHLHPDHFDQTAIHALPKDIAIFTQNQADAETVRGYGFVNVGDLQKTVHLGEIKIQRTNGQHGIGEITKRTGKVSGLIFKHPDEKTLYVAGDTIWCQDVEEAIQQSKPQIIVVNGGAAQYLEGGHITMTKEDIYKTQQAAPAAKIVVVHMESLNHCLLSRDELKAFIEDKGLSKSILLPDDGEGYSF